MLYILNRVHLFLSETYTEARLRLKESETTSDLDSNVPGGKRPVRNPDRFKPGEFPKRKRMEVYNIPR